MNTEQKHSDYEELMQYLEEAQAYETALSGMKRHWHRRRQEAALPGCRACCHPPISAL